LANSCYILYLVRTIMKHVIDFADILKKDNIGDNYKFVRVNGSYRFGWVEPASDEPVQHDDLVSAEEEDSVEAAGTIGVWDNGFQLVRDYSMTLDKGCTEEDMRDIELGLELPYMGKI